ncbi:hypothetical protein Bca101_015659 [Brassica carinata]
MAVVGLYMQISPMKQAKVITEFYAQLDMTKEMMCLMRLELVLYFSKTVAPNTVNNMSEKNNLQSTEVDDLERRLASYSCRRHPQCSKMKASTFSEKSWKNTDATNKFKLDIHF